MSEAKCSIEECERIVLAKLMCGLHYDRSRRLGDPMPHVPPRRYRATGSDITDTLEFYSEPAPEGECVEWNGFRNDQGYGMVRVGGSTVGAHRLSCEAATGVAPGEELVRHRCDNPPCINPEHLVLGDHKSNAQDKVERGRHLRGDTSPAAKLTSSQVSAMRDMRRGGHSYEFIGKRFGVGVEGARSAITGSSWAELSGAVTDSPPAHKRGAAHHFSKLDEVAVLEIREAALAGESSTEIAARYGVTRQAIAGAVAGRTWKHVPMPELVSS